MPTAQAIAAALRVLVVEDDAQAARMLAQLLREDGYDVEVAVDGAAAVARLGYAPPPDALVVDYRLPHVDGLAVARFALSRCATLGVVMVTSYPEVLARSAEPTDACIVTLPKPLAYADLTRELARIQGECRARVAAG